MKTKPWMPLTMFATMALLMLGMMWLFSYLIGGPGMLPMILLMTQSSGVGLGGLLLIGIGGLLLMGGLMILIMRWMSGWLHSPAAAEAGQGVLASDSKTEEQDSLVFEIPDINCQGCKITVESLLEEIPGVHAISVDVAAKQARVQLVRQPTRSEIEEILKNAGYPAVVAAGLTDD